MCLSSLLGQVIDLTERQEIDAQMPTVVAGLHSLQSAFSALLEGNHHKQVVLLTNSDDERYIQVRCSLYRDLSLRLILTHYLDTAEDFPF